VVGRLQVAVRGLQKTVRTPPQSHSEGGMGKTAGKRGWVEEGAGRATRSIKEDVGSRGASRRNEAPFLTARWTGGLGRYDEGSLRERCAGRNENEARGS